MVLGPVNCGVFYVAIGQAAQTEARLAIKALRNWHDWPVWVASDGLIEGEVCITPPPGCDKLGRLAKVSLFDSIPPSWDAVLYLDADTRVLGDLSAGFKILEAGFDVVITPSMSQGDDLMWHIDPPERVDTLLEIENALPLQLQGGVIWAKRSPAACRLFEAWVKEWKRYGGQDQAALLRALYNHDHGARLWLLSHLFNDGPVISHRHGMARSRSEWITPQP